MHETFYLGERWHRLILVVGRILVKVFVRCERLKSVNRIGRDFRPETPNKHPDHVLFRQIAKFQIATKLGRSPIVWQLHLVDNVDRNGGKLLQQSLLAEAAQMVVPVAVVLPVPTGTVAKKRALQMRGAFPRLWHLFDRFKYFPHRTVPMAAGTVLERLHLHARDAQRYVEPPKPTSDHFTVKVVKSPPA